MAFDVLSLTHAVVCLPLAMVALWDLGWSPSSPDMMDLDRFWYMTTESSSNAIAFSGGYFLWELVLELRHVCPSANLVHALLSFTAYGIVGWYLQYGHLVLCLALTLEASTPAYHAVQITKDQYYASARGTDPKQLKRQLKRLDARRFWSQIAFALVFFAVRVVWQPIMIWLVWPYMSSGWHLAPARIAFVQLSVSMALNLYWFKLIILAAKRHFQRQPS